MAFDWNDYQAFSKVLITTATSECDYRNIVSRSYYAAYNICLAHLKTVDTGYRANSDSHITLINKFIESGGLAKKIGNHLNTLRSNRVNADYKSNAIINKNSAQTVIGLVDRILADIPNAQGDLTP